ncbi:Uncharacterized protein TCM_022054 [Theobroma cacao]|uniref:Cyclin F-box n=1 Tax=Theobroma cacao TaxID=3641 RepID=A0A061ERQ7_THECC|nr:Uncharacterized protein TCM_022054 [Theobroma cacao]
MIACNKEDNKWSERKMEGDDGLRTVECLRGRLLAERQASRTAKEDAELMGNKLIELENKLKEETKLRNKAEKRLKLLKKKLESLKILPSLEESEQSSSSENCAVSSVSSTSTSGAKDPEESASKSQNAVPEISKNVEENASDTTTSIKSLQIPFSEENATSPGTAQSDSKDSSHKKSSGTSSSNPEDPKIGDTSSSSLKASTMEIDMKGRNENYEDDDYVDNSMALVPLKLPETKLAPEIKIVSKSIGEVLDTLRHARERIQNSMERRQMIRVGPS